MDYYDGNTVTALWNYAQRFAMSDNNFDTTFGPSTPGVLNLVSGQTHGAVPTVLAGVTDNGTDYGDADPTYDECSAGSTIAMTGTNIGDALNARHVTWGWFQGGFTPTGQSNGTVVCGSSHTNVGGAVVADYSAHHEPFQYYASTANPAHLPPATEAEIGHNGQANHQYDLSYFSQSLTDGNLPAVSFVKAAKYQDGHAGYSDPIDEQAFLVNTINAVEQSKFWKSTAIIVTYDDSDGWYDQVMPPIVNSSTSTEDALSGTGHCGSGTPAGGFEDRCGYGQRLPLLVISPYARENSVDNAITDTTSILRFIEDNWSVPRIGGGSFDALAGSIDGMFNFSHRIGAPLILNPSTGEPAV
jgi:phospholipase C